MEQVRTPYLQVYGLPRFRNPDKTGQHISNTIKQK